MKNFFGYGIQNQHKKNLFYSKLAEKAVLEYDKVEVQHWFKVSCLLLTQTLLDI